MGSPTFRVTTYQLADADFIAGVFRVHLRRTLETNYFAMCEFGTNDIDPANVGNATFQITADPYGTGDLAQSGGNWLEITCSAPAIVAAESLVGTITVVECLRDSNNSGFRLLDVKITTLPVYALAGLQTGTDTSGTAWNKRENVVLFSGHRGGGITSTTATSTTWYSTFGVETYPSSTDVINWARQSAGTTQCVAASLTTYVVEFGIEWDIQGVEITGTNFGADCNAVGEYSTAALGHAVTRANTWIWASVSTRGAVPTNSFWAQVITLGNGVDENASESTVAASCWTTPNNRSIYVYALQHPSLSVDYYFHATADTTRVSTITVPAAIVAESYYSADEYYLAATEGTRIALAWLSTTSATANFSEQMGSTRPTASTTVTFTRADRGTVTYGWAGWLCTADFGSVQTATDSEPVFRVTTIHIDTGIFTGTTLDIQLPYDLSANYFVLIRGTWNGASPAVGETYCRITQDGNGTGDLVASAGANFIRLERGLAASQSWTGNVTIVECLRDPDGDGFRLIDVDFAAVAAKTIAGIYEDDYTANSAWTAPERVVLFAGHRGAGFSTDSASTARHPSGHVAAGLRPNSLDTYFLRRILTSDELEDGTYTVFVVQFGKNWQVSSLDTLQKLTTNYIEINLGQSFNAAKTWIHGSVLGWDNDPDDGACSVAFALGDGSAAPGSSEDSIALSMAAASTGGGIFYLLTHANLFVEWKAVDLASGDVTDDITVSTPRSGEGYGTMPAVATPYIIGTRFGISYNKTTQSTEAAWSQALYFERHTGLTTLQVERNQSGSAATGWIQSVDFGDVQTFTASDPSASDDDAKGPVQYLILQDPWWEGVATSATSEAGRMAGPLVADVDNYGSMVGFQDGVPSTSEEIDYKMIHAGAPGEYAAFVRKGSTQVAGKWCGYNAPTAFMHQNPIGNTTKFYASTVAFSTVYNRVLILVMTSATQLTIYYRDIATNQVASWSSTTETIEDGVYNDGDSGMDCVELPDGTLLLTFETLPGSYYSMDTYISEDGGLNWTRVHRKLPETQMNDVIGTVALGGIRMAISGDWIRIIRFDGTQDKASGGMNVVTYVSGDRGASWAKLVTSIAIIPRGGTGANSNFGWWVHSLEGCGDQAGTFILLVEGGTNGEKSLVYIASGSDEWTAHTGLDIDWSAVLTNGRPLAQTMLREGRLIWLWTLLTNTAPDVGTFHCRTIDVVDPTDSSNWTNYGAICSLRGSPDYVPITLKGKWCGDHAVIHGGIVDVTDNAGDNFVNGSCTISAGQWDTMPFNYTVSDTELYPVTRKTNFGNIQNFVYWTWEGAPDTLTGGGWTFVSSGTGAHSWSAQEEYYTASSGDTCYHRYNAGVPSPLASEGWSDSAFSWIFAVYAERAGSDPASNTDMGLRVITRTTVTDGMDFTVRIGATKLCIYDNHAASLLSTTTGVDFSSRAEFRLAIEGTDLFLSYRALGTGEDDWTKIASVTASTAATAGQEIQIGVLASIVGANTSECAFSEIFKSYRFMMGQNHGNITYPDDLCGREALKHRTHVRNGVYAKWGGGGAFVGDLFTGEIDHTRGMENLGFDSPRLMWESTSLVQNALVFRAGTSGTVQRWQLNALLLVGTVDRTATLEFSTTDSWTAPAVSVQLDADLFTDLIVKEVDGSMFKIEAGPSGRLPDRIAQVQKCYARFTASGVATGITVEIKADHDKGNGWFHVADDKDLVALGVVPGASCVFFGDRMVWRSSDFKRYEYFRIVFPNVSSVASTLGTATGTHRLGSLIPGFVRTFDVPLDWTITDNEQPNATDQQTKGAVDWVHYEGPPQRTITGRIVGDITEFRRALRGMLNKLHDYSRRPAGLVLDSQNLNPDTVIYGRWRSGGQQDEAAWKQDDNGVWRMVGDMDLVFTEIV